MPDKRPFHLRHFSLLHQQSTMKVGTDAIILGAWVNTDGLKTILDAGTGCGILALMIAQRTGALIHAVEIDKLSANEAEVNFQTSQWHERLKVFHANFIDFPALATHNYDLIISNPPFFTSTFKTQQPRRNLARHTHTLRFEDLIATAGKLLNKDGRLAVVLPMTESEAFIKLAAKHKLYPHRMLKIIPVRGREANRINLEFGIDAPDACQHDTFILRETDRRFTQAYRKLLKPYYLGL